MTASPRIFRQLRESVVRLIEAVRKPTPPFKWTSLTISQTTEKFVRNGFEKEQKQVVAWFNNYKSIDKYKWPVLQKKLETSFEKNFWPNLKSSEVDRLWAGWNQMSKDLGVGMSWPPPAFVQAYLEKRKEFLMKSIPKTTMGYIQTLHKHATAEKWTPDKLAAAVSKRYEEFKFGQPPKVQSRSKMIAMTEDSAAYEAGAQAMADSLVQQGKQIEKKWRTQEDNRVTAGCQANGKKPWIENSWNFPSGHAHPPRFPNCRCWIERRLAKPKKGAAADVEQTPVAPVPPAPIKPLGPDLTKTVIPPAPAPPPTPAYKPYTPPPGPKKKAPKKKAPKKKTTYKPYTPPAPAAPEPPAPPVKKLPPKTRPKLPPAKVFQEDDDADFPDGIEGLQEIGKLGGSTGARLMQDPKTGKKYVLKRGASAAHVAEEMAADSAYRALGVAVPRFKSYDGGKVKLAEFIEGKTLDRVTGAEKEAAAEQLRKHFAADALLGNWDVLGMSQDNVLLDTNGKVWRIDNGGSLSYRAQGGKKKDKDYTDSATELFTLRDPKKNAQTASVFGKVSILDIADQAVSFKGQRSALEEALKAQKLAPAVVKKTMSRFDNLTHWGRTAQTMAEDYWKEDYIEEFIKAAAEIRHAGILDKLPKKLTSSPAYGGGKGKETRLGFKQYDVQPVDENGKKFDNLRGKTLLDPIEKYTKSIGGDWKIIKDYTQSQAGSSWGDTPLALKHFIAEQRDVPKNAYFWKGGVPHAERTWQEKVSKYGSAEKMRKTFIVAHAMTHEMLSELEIQNATDDNYTFILTRTESKSVTDSAGLSPGAKDALMRRGALESSSLYHTISVFGTEVTTQKVPLHRIFFTYLTSSESDSSGGAFAGDSENELMFIPEGLPFDYETWKVHD